MSVRTRPALLLPLIGTAVTHGWTAQVDPRGGEVHLHLARETTTVDICWERLAAGFRLVHTIATQHGEIRDITTNAAALSALLTEPDLLAVGAR
jgi:hypothetical protein